MSTKSIEIKRDLARAMAKRRTTVPTIDEARKTAALPVAAGYQRLPFDEIERQYAALDALSQRGLPSIETEDKVFTLLRRHYEDAHQIFLKLRNNAIGRHPAPKDSDEADLPYAVKEARSEAVQDVLDTYHDIPEVPASLVLTPADMPRRDLKGEVGAANKMSVAFIKHRLGFLYPLEDERTVTVEEEE
jgi:hypothetical protein